MPMNGPFDGGDPPDMTDPADVLEGIEPETVDGPLGLPIVKPKGAPDLPDPGSGRGGPFDL